MKKETARPARMLRSCLYHVAIRCVGLIPTTVLRAFLTLVHRRSDVADHAGFSVFPLCFYNPFPEPSQVDLRKLESTRTLPGIDFRTSIALTLLGQLNSYKAEAAEFLKNRQGDLRHRDGTFSLNDSAVLYAMLRHLKPKRYIEIGCGYSSVCSAAALARNEREGRACRSLLIEPYPPPFLSELAPPAEFLNKKVQEVPLERFVELQEGDVLFIDTSHVIKTQNDVEHELLRILPILAPGVIVHIHDIFTPYDYPADWVVGTSQSRCGNNEQYAVECVLSGNDAWEVILPVHLLWAEHPQALRELTGAEDPPGSFWFKKVKQVRAPAEGQSRPG